MDAIQSCWVNASGSVPIQRLQKHAREGAPQCRGIKRASKEPNEGLRKSRGIGARNPCRIEYMGVYEILILPGGTEGGGEEQECEVTLAPPPPQNQPTFDEGGRKGCETSSFFAPHSLPFPARLPTRIQIDLSYRASVGRADAARVIDHSRRPPDACVHIAMGTDHTRRQAQNTHRPRPTTQQRREGRRGEELQLPRLMRTE